MSSTERAPEPTMEEILASIRRIISDDESSSARQRTAPQPDEDVLEGGDGEADDEVINDIARVLSGSGGATSQPTAEAPAVDAEYEEDILDLTAELGGLELVEEVEEIELVEVVAEAASEIFEPVPARPRPVQAPVEASPELESEPELELVEEAAPEAPEAEASAPEPAPQPKAPEAQPAQAAPKPMSASEEAASALERAIAALRAGQVPTSSTPFSYQPPPEPAFTAPEPVFQPQPEPAPRSEPPPSIGLAPSFEAVPAPEPVSVPEPLAEAEAEPELVLTEFEVQTVEAEPVVETVTSEPQVDRLWRMRAAPDWAAQTELETEEEAEMPHVNGGETHPPYAAASAPKSLEDSVKDMLRPMLRQWLDENMARVLTAALKDELKSNPSRLTGD
jgi:cell pole-organizing protein PopZ